MLRTLLLLLVVAAASAAAQTSLVPQAFWPCNNKTQRIFDSNGQTNTYVNDLDGGAWNETSAQAKAAGGHHQYISCQNSCPQPGCVKIVQWTSDKVTYVDGPGGESGNEFTYTIKNFKIWGFCTGC